MNLTEAVRRLMGYSYQNALAQLVQPNGFMEQTATQIRIPENLGGRGASSLASLLLKNPATQDRLVKLANQAAAKGADVAAPIIAETVRNMSIPDALAVVRGGPTAATQLLQRQLGNTLVQRMTGEIGSSMQLLDSDLVGQLVSRASGVDMIGISKNIAQQANDSIFRAIGSQEAAIRADPKSTNDPLIMAVYALSK